jgi:hypothetical protein
LFVDLFTIKTLLRCDSCAEHPKHRFWRRINYKGSGRATTHSGGQHVRSTARHTIHLQFNSTANASYVLLTVQSTAHQTIHFGLCTALISRALALISSHPVRLIYGLKQ